MGTEMQCKRLPGGGVRPGCMSQRAARAEVTAVVPPGSVIHPAREVRECKGTAEGKMQACSRGT